MRLIVLMVLISVHLIGGEGPDRGMKPGISVSRDSFRYTSSNALIIANSVYSAGWDKLPGVEDDTVAIKDALELHGFKVVVSKNVSKDAFSKAVDTFVADHGQDPNGRLIIYYAGHGHTHNNIGYLVPVDAPSPDKDFTGFLKLAYPIQNIRIKSSELQCRHALFCFDSCFSGTIFIPVRGRETSNISATWKDKLRMFMTAGSANETVTDISYFRAEFINGINGEADRNGDGLVTGRELAEFVAKQVPLRAQILGKKMTPQYGVSEQSGQDKGEIIFIPPQSLGLSVVTTANGNVEKLRAEAQVYQELMRKSFDQVLKTKADSSGKFEQAIAAAEQFLNKFSRDNPFSSEDEVIRQKIRVHLLEMKGLKTVELLSKDELDAIKIGIIAGVDDEIHKLLKKLRLVVETTESFKDVESVLSAVKSVGDLRNLYYTSRLHRVGNSYNHYRYVAKDWTIYWICNVVTLREASARMLLVTDIEIKKSISNLDVFREFIKLKQINSLAQISELLIEFRQITGDESLGANLEKP